MTTSMLIDAVHPEETRVAVVKKNRLEEFDYETSTKKQLKGNIYLAKVTRVEPSLQAAFVEYGGGRNGFLVFSEIHPDYYQIPVADRKALIEAQAAEQAESEKEALNEENNQSSSNSQDSSEIDTTDSEINFENDNQHNLHETSSDESVNILEEVGGANEDELVKRNTSDLLKSYKIQEVIKKRQIILVQVTKEERGNKGAALTTYISLAGRYCVLMPNTARGGGISRKISNINDRKKLREIVESLNVPKGMALIVRTAGAQKTKPELRRDYDYLYRSWEEIRETTLVSRAPVLINEEANLIKRSIRDIYNKDIEEVLVEGEEAYKVAKKHMKMLLPSHAKRVQPYKDEIPILNKFKVDSQLDAMLDRKVELKSGGHLVIDSTEALVAIDVNSGRSTRERNIEETALKTNIEAAIETARQLRLRDLAGLIVVDFIDMSDNRNNRVVERKFKESLRLDRARIQVGRISSFGLLEMSRQRIRPSIIEANTEPCLICLGSGFVRSTESAALQALRKIEEEANKKNSIDLKITAPEKISLYLLNQKRQSIRKLEESYDISIIIDSNTDPISPEISIEQIIASNNRNTNTSIEETDKSAKPSLDDESSKHKKRRRGKRGGSKNKKRDTETEKDFSSKNITENKKQDLEKNSSNKVTNLKKEKSKRNQKKYTAKPKAKQNATTTKNKINNSKNINNETKTQPTEDNLNEISSNTKPQKSNADNGKQNKEKTSESNAKVDTESNIKPIKRNRKGWWNRKST